VLVVVVAIALIVAVIVKGDGATANLTSRGVTENGAFGLGRLEMPVAIGALAWTAVSMFVLVSPGTALVPCLIVVGLLIAGGLFLLGLLKFSHEALETRPGDVSAFRRRRADRRPGPCLSWVKTA
jgi:hypothetical protein